MKVDPSIFKAYDIRGTYQENLDEKVAHAVGKAFIKVVNPSKVVLGRDGRVSSPSLHQALMDSLLNSGVNVLDVGQVSTDMYYYACAQTGLPGIMITASHNPKQYNGFKMVKKIPYLLSGDEGIQDMRVFIENDDLPLDTIEKGTQEKWDVMAEFIEKMLSLVDTTKLKPMKVVADTANGMVGPSLTELFKQLPQLQLTPLYFDVDGTFPNHGGDPLQSVNRRELQERVVAEQADLGFAFDPDGDRFFCIDARGRFVSGDFMTALLAQYFLAKKPNASIVYDLRASWAVPDLVTAAHGKALYNRVGHAFIKKRMMDENAIFGGEVTGHYYFQDFFYCDSGIAPMLFLLDLLTHSDKKLDVLLDELGQKYFISGEINTSGVDGDAVMMKLEQTYAPSAKNVLKDDGISIEYDEWHFNVRKSNTEPLVRLNLEAKDQKTMEEKRDEILAVIQSYKKE